MKGSKIMARIKEGDKAPDFTLPADGNREIGLKDFSGRPLVLYFYPKDDTPGCTQESCDFRDNMKAFEKLGVQVLGISRDSVKRHDNFKKKYDLNFPLLSDEDQAVCESYGVWVEKSMYGRKYFGIERSTFLIDEKGIINHIWRKVKVKGHVDEVRQAADDLSKAA